MEDTDKKIPDSSKFIMARYCNRLTKANFNARMTEALKKLSTKKKIKNAFDLGNKNRAKKKL